MQGSRSAVCGRCGRELFFGRPQGYPWVAPRARIGLRVALGRGVGLWFAGEGAVPLVKPVIDVAGARGGTLWRTQPASVRVMLGVDFRWVR